MAVFAIVYVARALNRDRLWIDQRILSRRRILRLAALRLGVPQALRPAGRAANLFHLLCARARHLCRGPCSRALRTEWKPMTAPLRRSRPMCSSARPPRCARPAWRWCRPRSRSATTRSGTRSAAQSTACRRRWCRPTRPTGSAARTTSSRATGRSRSRTAPSTAARTTAACAPTTSSTPAWRSSRSTRHCNLTCPVCFADSSPAAHHAPAAGNDRAHARRPGGERGRARPGADLRRRADPASRILRHPRRGAAPADPPCDDQHQRHPHRRGPATSSPRWRKCKRGLRSLPAVRFAQARGADEPARRRSAGACARRRSATSSGTASRPRWSVTVKRGVNDERDRRDRAPRAAMALRARRHLPAGAGCRPQRGLRQAKRPHRAVRDPPPHRRGLRRVRRRRHDPAAVQSGLDLHRLRPAQRQDGAAAHLAGAARGAAVAPMPNTINLREISRAAAADSSICSRCRPAPATPRERLAPTAVLPAQGRRAAGT